MKRGKSKDRKVRSHILIVCEGETERNYFRAIKEDDSYKKALTALTVEIVTAKHHTPDQVVNQAIKMYQKAQEENNPYNQVWVVFDHDNHVHRKKAYEKAVKKDYRVAFSAIAFEIWYLLHFTQSTRAFSNGDELVRELKQHYKGYEKARQNDFAFLKNKLEEAFKNSKWLRNQCEEIHITDHPAWTNVDYLVAELISQNADG